MARRKTNPDFLTGAPELLLLQLLSRKPMHGYAVVQAITTATSGELKFGEGSIYPILHRLESERKLTTKRVEHKGRGAGHLPPHQKRPGPVGRIAVCLAANQRGRSGRFGDTSTIARGSWIKHNGLDKSNIHF